MAQAEQRRGAVTNLIYPRSVFSSVADRIGDLPGRRARGDHSRSLGVDATPCRGGATHCGAHDIARRSDWMTLHGLS